MVLTPGTTTGTLVRHDVVINPGTPFPYSLLQGYRDSCVPLNVTGTDFGCRGVGTTSSSVVGDPTPTSSGRVVRKCVHARDVSRPTVPPTPVFGSPTGVEDCSRPVS